MQGSGHSLPPSSTNFFVASTPTLGAQAEGGGGVIQHVDGAVHHHQVALRVHVGEGAPGALGEIVDVHVLVEDHERLGGRHLPRAPQPVHELPRVTRELLADGEEAEVVEDPLGREGHVHHLGEDELEHGQEEPLGGGAHPVVLHGRRPDHGGRVDRVPAARDGGDLRSGCEVQFSIRLGLRCKEHRSDPHARSRYHRANAYAGTLVRTARPGVPQPPDHHQRTASELCPA